MQDGPYYISFYCQVWGNLALQLHSSKPNAAQGHSKKRMRQLFYIMPKIPSTENRDCCQCSVEQLAQPWLSQEEIRAELSCRWSRSCLLSPAVAGEPSWAAVFSLATRLHSPAWDAGSWDTHGSTELGAPSVPLWKAGVVGKLSAEEWEVAWVTCCTETDEERGKTAKMKLVGLINWTPAKHSWEKVWSFIKSFSCCHLSSLFSGHLDHPCLHIVSILVLAREKFSLALQRNRSGTDTS